MRNFAPRDFGRFFEVGMAAVAVDYEKLNTRLCLMDIRAALIEYIWRVQQDAAGRIDFDAAAAELGCSARTVGRSLGILAQNGLVILENGANGGTVRLSPEILK